MDAGFGTGYDQGSGSGVQINYINLDTGSRTISSGNNTNRGGNSSGGGAMGHSNTLTILSPPPPVAEFTYSILFDRGNCLKVVFSNASQGANSQTWSFGDGTTSTSKNPAHTFKEYGTFTINLSIKGDGGTSNKSITITLEKPVLDYSVKLSPDGLTATFDPFFKLPRDVYYDYDEMVAALDSLQWTFQDVPIETKTGRVVEHKYAVKGDYLVSVNFSSNVFKDKIVSIGYDILLNWSDMSEGEDGYEVAVQFSPADGWGTWNFWDIINKTSAADTLILGINDGDFGTVSGYGLESFKYKIRAYAMDGVKKYTGPTTNNVPVEVTNTNKQTVGWSEAVYPTI